MTETTVMPSSTPGSRSLRSAFAMSSNAPTKCGDAKQTRRSGSSPSNRSRTSAVSPTACEATGWRERADAKRVIAANGTGAPREPHAPRRHRVRIDARPRRRGPRREDSTLVGSDEARRRRGDRLDGLRDPDT